MATNITITLDETNSDDSSGSQPATSKPKVKKQIRLTKVSERSLNTLEKQHPGVFVKCKKSNVSTKPKVICTVCNIEINLACGLKDAANHVKTTKHQNSVQAKKGQQDLFSVGCSKRSRDDCNGNAVLDAEMMLSQFIAASNLSFATAPKLVK